MSAALLQWMLADMLGVISSNAFYGPELRKVSEETAHKVAKLWRHFVSIPLFSHPFFLLSRCATRSDLA
jgi:hypothetical protein